MFIIMVLIYVLVFPPGNIILIPFQNNLATKKLMTFKQNVTKAKHLEKAPLVAHLYIHEVFDTEDYI